MGKTALVVDDSLAMRALLGVALRTAGYTVVEARDGKDALDKLAAAPVDLIISDCIMPVMDGLSLVRELKARPALREIPVIMLTTESQSCQIQEGKALGVQAWIVKPFQTDRLVEAVGRYCTRQETP